jgi:hypothetical protein
MGSHEGTEREQRYNSTHSLTTTLDGGRWSVRTSMKKPQYLVYRRQHGSQGWYGSNSEMSSLL